MRILTSVFMILGMASVAFAGEAESEEAKIARARSAAPAAVSAEATVVDADGTVLHEGSNEWMCHAGLMPGDDHPMCNDGVWRSFMKALSEKKPFQTDRVGFSYMLQGDARVNNADPFDTEENEGEVWVQEGPHLMVIVPDAKMLEGLPTTPSDGPYVMWGDTPYAHVMVPVPE